MENQALEVLQRLAWRNVGAEMQCAACNYRMMVGHVPPDAPQHWDGCEIASLLGYKTEPMLGLYDTPMGRINVVERLTPNVWRYEKADGTSLAPTESGNLVLPWSTIVKVRA